MKIEYQDRIENYLLNRMSDADRLAFEEELDKDAELRDQYEFVSMVKTSLLLENIDKDVCEWSKAYKRIEQEAKEREEQKKAASYRPTGTDCNYCPAPRMEQMPIVSHTFSRKILYWVSGIAAVFIVGVFIFNQHLTLYSPSSKGIAMESSSKADYSSPKKDGNISFRGRSQMDIESQLAMGDYSKALAQIDKDEANVRTELMLNAREMSSRGVSKEDADEELDSLENKLSQLLYWKAKALIGLNRKDEAVVILNEIRISNGNYKEQADSLYNILNK